VNDLDYTYYAEKKQKYRLDAIAKEKNLKTYLFFSKNIFYTTCDHVANW